MANQQHLRVTRINRTEAHEQIGRPRVVEAILEPDLRITESVNREIEGCACASRRRAEHEIGLQLVLGCPSGNPLGCPLPARSEGAIVIGEAGVVPTRLCMSEQPQALHQPRLQPRTSSI
jgi:hypothetical protein